MPTGRRHERHSGPRGRAAFGLCVRFAGALRPLPPGPATPRHGDHARKRRSNARTPNAGAQIFLCRSFHCRRLRSVGFVLFVPRCGQPKPRPSSDLEIRRTDRACKAEAQAFSASKDRFNRNRTSWLRERKLTSAAAGARRQMSSGMFSSVYSAMGKPEWSRVVASTKGPCRQPWSFWTSYPPVGLDPAVKRPSAFARPCWGPGGAAG